MYGIVKIPYMYYYSRSMKQRDTHLKQVIQNIRPKTPNGCEECLQTGSDWVRLRLCLTYGRLWFYFENETRYRSKDKKNRAIDVKISSSSSNNSKRIKNTIKGKFCIFHDINYLKGE